MSFVAVQGLRSRLRVFMFKAFRALHGYWQNISCTQPAPGNNDSGVPVAVSVPQETGCLSVHSSSTPPPTNLPSSPPPPAATPSPPLPGAQSDTVDAPKSSLSVESSSTPSPPDLPCSPPPPPPAAPLPSPQPEAEKTKNVLDEGLQDETGPLPPTTTPTSEGLKAESEVKGQREDAASLLPNIPPSTSFGSACASEEGENVVKEEKALPQKELSVSVLPMPKGATAREVCAAVLADGGNSVMSHDLMHKIELKTSSQKLGVAIVGGADNPYLREPHVRQVLDGGVAQEDGRLKRGDRILSINGQRMEGMTKGRVLHVLRNAEAEEKVVTMVIARKTRLTTSSQLSRYSDGSTQTAGATACPEVRRFTMDEMFLQDKQFPMRVHI